MEFRDVLDYFKTALYRLKMSDAGFKASCAYLYKQVPIYCESYHSEQLKSTVMFANGFLSTAINPPCSI